jgi:hypothetical protein
VLEAFSGVGKAFNTDNTEKNKMGESLILCGLLHLADACLQSLRGERGLFLIDNERRRDANRILAGAQEEKTFLER